MVPHHELAMIRSRLERDAERVADIIRKTTPWACYTCDAYTAMANAAKELRILENGNVRMGFVRELKESELARFA